MKRSGIALSLVSLALVLCVTSWERGKASPGPLSPPHSEIDRRGSPESCEACHGSEGQGLAEACARCHEEIGAQLAEGRGFHGGLPGAKARDCAACHGEHAGDELELVSSLSFELSGVPHRDEYGHAGLSFGLVGAHQGLACRECHRHADLEFVAKGQRRFLGLTQDCTACHDDVHEGGYGAACARCHGQAHPFPEVAEFEHTSDFPLQGGHAGRECSTCHDPASEHSAGLLIEKGAAAIRRCRECHADPHVATGGGAPERLLLAEADDCSRCHGVEEFAGVRFGAAEHEEIGVPLAGPHGSAECGDCHSAERLFAGAGEGGRLARCLACHESPHGEGFALAAAERARRPLEESCSECHDASHDTFARPPAGMSEALHEASGFSLAPPHRGLECASCHGAGGRPFAERFPGRAAAACGECHGDPHRGQFDEGPFAGSGCLACHDRLRFVPSSFTPELHRRGRFELVGAHQAVPCSACHELPTADARPADRVFRGTPRACGACHEDVHRGAFDRAGAPAEVDGRVGCERCHDTGSFRKLRIGTFDHGRWTGHPLRGAHREAACDDCHATEKTPTGRILGEAPKACAACHEDPHLGQFRRNGRVSCDRCHRDEERFDAVVFDHQRDSAFKLDEDHRRLECAACHRPYPVAGGRSVIRYRPLGTRCEDCHDSRPAGRSREGGR